MAEKRQPYFAHAIYMTLVLELEPLLWSLKYTPADWSDFIGQDRSISHLKNLAESGSCPNMILYGPYGTGKTSAALKFAREFLGDNFASNFKILNVRSVVSYPTSKAKRDLKTLAKLDRSERTEFDEYMSVVFREVKEDLKRRDISRDPNKTQMLQGAIRMFASTMAVSDEMIKVLVLDEADALTNSMQQALRRTMEIYNNVCRFIFVTPSLSGWSPAIISRCIPLNFPYPPQDKVKLLVESIALKEGVSIEPMALDAIARESGGDMRRATNLLQIAAAYEKTITEDYVYQCTETPLTEGVRQMITMAIDGSFKKSRKALRRLLALERYSPKEVLLEIERDIVKRPFQPLIMSQVLDRLSEIDHRVVQASNPFIQITAFLASLQRIAAEIAA